MPSSIDVVYLGLLVSAEKVIGRIFNGSGVMEEQMASLPVNILLHCWRCRSHPVGLRKDVEMTGLGACRNLLVWFQF